MSLDPSTKQSDWNTAGFTNFRFHQLKSLAHEARLEKDYSTWLTVLFGFYSELHPQLKQDEQERILEQLKIARDAIKIKEYEREGVFDTLFSVECELEIVFDKHGNKFSYREDGSTALGRI